MSASDREVRSNKQPLAISYSDAATQCCMPRVYYNFKLRAAAVVMGERSKNSMSFFERTRRPSYPYYKRHYAIRRKVRYVPAASSSATSSGAAATSWPRRPQRQMTLTETNSSPSLRGPALLRRTISCDGRQLRRVSTVVQPNISSRRPAGPGSTSHAKLHRATWPISSGTSLKEAEVVLASDSSEDDASKRKAITGEIEIDGEGGRRTLRSTCDWTETALNGEHLWLPTSASGDLCYVSEHDCCKTGSRMKCAACKIVCHTGCIANLTDKIKFGCKPSFRDVGVRQYRDNTATAHHWVHRRNLKGKCKHCSKSFTSKLSFSNTKEIVAISCSWCKTAYHNKEPCFSIQRLEEQCSLGVHADIIVPPSWIVKLPRRGSFKSSLRKSSKKRSSSRRKSKERVDKDQSRTFAIKPIPTPNVKPLVVFLNPKSGGNQGVKLMQKFQWLLNPRQVFDLTQGGPKAGLEMYRKVPNLRVLACGGDGTVGWVLSVLDQMNFNPPPAIGVLPLGTGNDLARSLGWGGGYTDEPISKILCNISDGESQELDRWEAKVVPNREADISEPGKDNLPLNVINNYFSLGVDAQIALQFHEAREARPDKFSSRLRNKVFYGQAGGRDLLQRKWKDLSEHVTILCDDKDITPKLKEHKVHAVLFLNIPSYGGGTHPWGGREQSTSDGCMEVIGLTTYQLPLLHAGGHGTVLAQCRKAELVTRCTIPMQVDGEACRVSPSVISISHLNRARMICKRRGRKSSSVEAHLEQMKIRISRISMADYEQYHYDKETLIQHSRALGVILVDMDADLEQVRQHINRLEEDSQQIPSLSSDWCFVDSCTAERFFRIDRAQEQLHYVTDVCAEHLYVLDTAAVVSPKLPVSNNNLLEHTSENIIIAAQNGDLTRVKQLHGSGVSLLSVNESGETALHVACAGGHKDVVRFLLANAPGSMVNMRDNIKGHTSLHRAASRCRRTICSMLVASGGSLTLLDNDGVTAKQMACTAGDPELAAYLESQERFQMMVADDHETSV